MLFLSNNSIACRKAGKTEKHNKNLCSLNIKISLRTTKDMDLFFGGHFIWSRKIWIFSFFSNSCFQTQQIFANALKFGGAFPHICFKAHFASVTLWLLLLLFLLFWLLLMLLLLFRHLFACKLFSSINSLIEPKCNAERIYSLINYVICLFRFFNCSDKIY